MIRYRGDIVIITNRNPKLLDGYEPVNGQLSVQKKILKKCDYRAETFKPGACCGHLTAPMKMIYECLIDEKPVTSTDCNNCNLEE